MRLYNDHGILLGVHGAGFINCAFMRQGSAVIEVFPYHVKHTLYGREASIAGLTHFPVYATDPTLTFKVRAGVWWLVMRCPGAATSAALLLLLLLCRSAAQHTRRTSKPAATASRRSSRSGRTTRVAGHSSTAASRSPCAR